MRNGINNIESFGIKSILLRPTAIVRLESNGRFKNERALIDPSSTCSIISEELARRISVRRTRVGSKEMGLLRIGGNDGSSLVLETYAEIRRKYQVILPTKSLDDRIIEEFPGLQLADPRFNVSAPLNLLLGADIYSRIIRNGVYGGSFGKPLAQYTIFGYIISGPCPQ